METNRNYRRDYSDRNPNNAPAPQNSLLLNFLGCSVYLFFVTSLSLSVGVFWLANDQSKSSIVIQRSEPGPVTAVVTERPKEESGPRMPPRRISHANKNKIFDSPDYKCLDGIECYEAGANLIARSKHREAAVQLERGCTMNNPYSCWKLGELEYHRLIPNASYEKADFYFRQSCFLGQIALGCLGLVDNLKKNFQPSSERDQAISQALDIACQQGIKKACNSSAVPSHSEARKKPEMLSEAQAQELTTACQEGDNKACFSMAQHYETHPELTPKERTDKARQIYEILCQRRDPQGCQSLRKIKRADGV